MPSPPRPGLGDNFREQAERRRQLAAATEPDDPSDHEAEFDRGKAAEIARRYGVGLDRGHNSLDKMRHPRFRQVGVPHGHDLTTAMCAALDEGDGVGVEVPGAARKAGSERPAHVNNVDAESDDSARRRVAARVDLDPEALGVRAHPRIFPPA